MARAIARGADDIIWDRLSGGSVLHAWVRCPQKDYRGGYKTLCGKHQPMTHGFTRSGTRKCPKCEALVKQMPEKEARG